MEGARELRCSVMVARLLPLARDRVEAHQGQVGAVNSSA